MEMIQNIHIQNITKILLDIGERVEGNLICDITPNNFVCEQNIHKIKSLQYLCKNKKKIIEIGVNACHSLIIMLLENPSADYLLFDLNCHKYVEPTISYVKLAFPNTNINIIYGNSVDVISKYIVDNPYEINTYDLVHLDGGHTENIFSCDYNNSKILLKTNGIVIFDDYDYPEIERFINKCINKNDIIEYNDSNIIKNSKQFIYNYK